MPSLAAIYLGRLPKDIRKQISLFINSSEIARRAKVYFKRGGHQMVG
jgi:hypothetical protein